MTIEEAKKRIVSLANSEVGYHEGVNNWNKYAEDPQIHKLYGWYPQNQPYCDIFVDWLFIKSFGYDLASAMTYQYSGKGSAACATSANYYKSHNAWYAMPAVGDQVFFIVSGGINHTGIVTSVGMGAITTVEGNSSDMVARRTYALGSPSIAGFGRPNWNLVANYEPQDEQSNDEQDAETEKPSFLYHTHQYFVKINLLKLGDYGPQVRNMQVMLDDAGYNCPANGQYDDTTYGAVKSFQEDNGLECDGEFGAKTFEALYNFSN